MGDHTRTVLADTMIPFLVADRTILVTRHATNPSRRLSRAKGPAEGPSLGVTAAHSVVHQMVACSTALPDSTFDVVGDHLGVQLGGATMSNQLVRRIRRPLVLITSAVLVLVTMAAEASPAAAQRPDRPLRVATFNIHHGAGLDGLVDLERIASVVEQGGAEVVGLQEVDRHFGERSNFVDQATWLAERLDMRVVFGANLDFDPLAPGAPRRQYGTAILSRYRIREWQNTLLPRPEGGEQRGLLEAKISVRGVRVRVFNTHLQHTSQVERLAQVARIKEVLAVTSESVVLLGDLNATPETPEIAAITEDLADSWVEAGVGDGFTYDAATPHARIDYVLSSPDIVARTAVVVSTDASDHLPVVVDLALPGSRVRRGDPTATEVLVESSP
jgi:endonuclease/exonuclease/phosphatase family metal-dependent hydrolase